MAVLEKMRVKMGAFITVIIAIALLAFIIDPDTLQSTLGRFSSKYDVGKMNGKGISYQDYQKKVDYFTKIYNISTGSTTTNEETQESIQNLAWQSLISDNVLLPDCEQAGIVVGDQEIIDMIQGIDFSPVLAGSGNFTNANGEIDKDAVLDFINMAESDGSGNYKLYWDYIQDNMIQERTLTKFSSLIEKSMIVNNLELQEDIANHNNTCDIEFVVKPVAFTADSTITVSNDEIKKYYDKIKSGLKKAETRDAVYAVFEVVPSEEDIQKAKDDVNSLYAEFTQTPEAEMKNFLMKNSDSDYRTTYFKKGELNSVSTIIDDFAANNGAGATLEPQFFNNTCIAAKVLDVAMRPDSVHIRYIPASTEKTADSLLAVLNKGVKFNEVAASQFPAEYLEQVPDVEKIGELGWVTEAMIPNYLPKEFAVAFSAKAGSNLKIANSGMYYVLNVDKITKPVRKAQVALLSREASPSQQTFSDFYAQANSLADQAHGHIDRLEKAASEKKIPLLPSDNIAGGAKTLSGYKNVKEVSRWIFDNKKGSVSNPIIVDNKYIFVAAVKEIHPAGYASVQDVASQIRSVLEMEKKVAKLASESKESVGANPVSLEEVAEKLNSVVNNQPAVTFASSYNSSQLDPKFIGAIAGASAKGNNNIIGPVEGTIGIYYFQIKDKHTGSYYTAEDTKQNNRNAAYQVLNALPQIMAADADVEDVRYKFY